MSKVDRDKPIIDMNDEERAMMWAELGATGAHQQLECARHKRPSSNLCVAAVVLMPRNEPVFWSAEFGDEDGIEYCRSVIEDIKLLPGLLLPGETVELKVYRITDKVEVTDQSWAMQENDLPIAD